MNSSQPKKSGLYMITCTPLDKHYVGASMYVTRRLNSHKSKLKRNCHDCQPLQAN
jgi:predicted GIY-YIG superfamily endonuclease